MQSVLEETTGEVKLELKLQPELTLDNLLNYLKLHNCVYITQSSGQKWSAIFMRNDKGELCFRGEDSVFYMSPDELADAHPHYSGTGSGWDHIRIASGIMKGTSIGRLVDRRRIAY